jgi:hypothetical protein
MFSFITSFVGKKTDKYDTIYRIYNVNKNNNIFVNESQEITFITSALIKSGLEDVTSVDTKWQIYVMNPPLYRVAHSHKYLNFLVGLIKQHHKHNDSYEILDDE